MQMADRDHRETQITIGSAVAAHPTTTTAAGPGGPGLLRWPKELPRQIAAVRDLVTNTDGKWTVEEVSRHFKGARRVDVAQAIESLAALGLVVGFTHDKILSWKAARFLAEEVR